MKRRLDRSDRCRPRAREQLPTLWTGIPPTRYTLPPRRAGLDRRPQCGQQLVLSMRLRFARACSDDINKTSETAQAQNQSEYHEPAGKEPPPCGPGA